MAIRRLTVERGWLTEQQFLDSMVLSRLTPGITILAQVMLIGKRVCGVRGLVAATVGLMLPAVVITVALARLYDLVHAAPAAATPLRYVAAVAAGFAVAMALTLLRDVLTRGHVWPGLLAVLGYTGLSLITNNPLAVLLVALAIGSAVPGLFRDKGRDGDA